MTRHMLTLPPCLWPEDLRERFEHHPLTAAQRKRLGRALGRWLKISHDRGACSRDISRETWLERTEGLSREIRNAVRQALAIAFPNAAASLYAEDNHRRDRPDRREQLRTTIARNLARFPDDWRAAAKPLLHIGEAGLGDGILVQAWAPSTIKRRLEAAALHFDYCRTRGGVVDIAPAGLRAKLREDQTCVESGKRRIGGVAADVDALTGFATAVRPDRSWEWLKTTRDSLKKLARSHGSRNASRAVDAAELRAAGQQLLDKADALHATARNRRELVAAHTKARTALMMILLAEAPIRITSCAEVELRSGLLDDLTGLFLDGSCTKEGDIDRRAFSATLTDAIGRYVGLHRAVVAAREETRMLVGERGGPIKAAQLSKNLGDFTEPLFGVRVTPHAVRHSVANFIVAAAPEKAALASVILNHCSDAVTPIYHQRANQIIASRRLRAATVQAAAEIGADALPSHGSRREHAKSMRGRGNGVQVRRQRRKKQA